jgi:hypothetical protein
LTLGRKPSSLASNINNNLNSLNIMPAISYPLGAATNPLLLTVNVSTAGVAHTIAFQVINPGPPPIVNVFQKSPKTANGDITAKVIGTGATLHGILLEIQTLVSFAALNPNQWPFHLQMLSINYSLSGGPTALTQKFTHASFPTANADFKFISSDDGSIFIITNRITII